jgi:ERCC4-type nuclease
MLLIVDTNEKSSNPKVFASMQRHFSKIIVTDLPHREHGGTKVTAGDVNIPLEDGKILAIERKTPTDFLQSIASRHIFDQVEVMANHAKYSAVIITGTLAYTDKTDIVVADGVRTDSDNSKGWSGRSVRAALNVIQYSGCPVVFCPPNQYCNMIEEIYSTVSKPDTRQGITKRRIITFPPVDERVVFLCGFPGISVTLADRLLKFAGMMDKNADEEGYGTVAGAIHWATIMGGIDKKERPEGWGASKILTVRKYLGLSSTEYLGLNSEEEEIKAEGE